MLITVCKIIVGQGSARLKLKRLAVLAAGLLVLAASFSVLRSHASAQNPRAESAPPARHVLVISVDGMGANWYMSPPVGLRVPNLRRLMEEGSYAEGVVGVYPSVTYPSHTTLVTGRMPAEHGVYSNLSSRHAGKNPNDWFWFASAIKVPTVWDVARESGLTTATVFWPVTTGGRINWDIPEIWDPAKGPAGDPLYIAKFATPGLLFEAGLELGPPKAEVDDDVTRASLAAFVLKKHKPNLLLLHLAALDETEHEHGPRSAEAIATLERSDVRIGELLTAVKIAGLADSTDVFIVSDHGFLPVEREINPNVLLAKAGLLQVDAGGEVTGGKIATLATGGAFFIYWPESQNLRSEVEAALQPLRDEGVLWGELGPAAVKDLGAEPAIRLALEAPSGAGFDDRAAGEVVRQLGRTAGTHGYLPFRAGLESSFIAWGPGIKKGVKLGRIPMTAVAPTLLKSLGIEKPGFGSRPALQEIFK
ncbi:MAG: ectonucleotide pyrophosphatase/phosphodiesterase [Terriglobia bacterium]